METWRPILSLPDFEASSVGRIRRVRGNRNTGPNGLIKSHPINTGYLAVTLNYKGQVFGRLVHRLVTEAFLGRCPPGQEVNHRNGSKTDNRLANLEYVSRSDNLRHSGAYRGERNSQACLTPAKVKAIRTAHSNGMGYKRLAKAYGCSWETIRDTIKQRSWAHVK